MAQKRSTVTELPEFNSRNGESTDMSHARRKALLVPLVEEMVRRKEAAGAFGSFVLELTWRAGEIVAVDITDHARYK